MNNIYDAKGIQESEFPDYDGIVRKAYDPSNGLLASYSSGVYGWYDVNNLPGYSSKTVQSNSDDDSDDNSETEAKETTSAAAQESE